MQGQVMFSVRAAEGVRPPTSVSPRRVAMKVAGLGGSADLTSEYRFPFIGPGNHKTGRVSRQFIVLLDPLISTGLLEYKEC